MIKRKINIQVGNLVASAEVQGEEGASLLKQCSPWCKPYVIGKSGQRKCKLFRAHVHPNRCPECFMAEAKYLKEQAKEANDVAGSK